MNEPVTVDKISVRLTDRWEVQVAVTPEDSTVSNDAVHWVQYLKSASLMSNKTKHSYEPKWFIFCKIQLPVDVHNTWAFPPTLVKTAFLSRDRFVLLRLYDTTLLKICKGTGVFIHPTHKRVD